MRLAWALCALLLAPGLAGCFAPAAENEENVPPLALSNVLVPDGAVLVQEAGRAILRFADVGLPFSTPITIPEGATIVRAVGVVAEGVPVAAYLSHADTGRRRCNTDVLLAWNVGVTGSSTCSGLAAVDPPGSVWQARVTGGASVAERVDVIFETTPLDGLAALLDLSKLSMPDHDVLDTEYLMVESFDGTPLWVEVTLPAGEGPWPTVIASSPYNGQFGRGVTPAMWAYFTHDWAKRGYAIVNADVRGYGMSGGCVEVWGESEQKDQSFLVEWVAAQEWSDGNVGFYGQSYVGTTPVAAAVQAPDALKAIIAVAPVINAYYDWHYGGVPNGENSLSPVAYQVLTDAPPGGDPTTTPPRTLVENNVKGICDPSLIVRANDPRAIYTDYYEERNFTARAGNVKAAVLYTQGYEDTNVKSAMIPGWFNAIEAPKLGLFGHFVHQHPPRADTEALFIAWMDEFVKGRDMGFGKFPAVEVQTNTHTVRRANEWPPTEPTHVLLQSDFAAGKLVREAPAASQALVLDGAVASHEVFAPTGATNEIFLAIDLEETVALAGVATLEIRGTLTGTGNAHFAADLYDGDTRVTYGMFNLAHRNGHDRFEPAPAGETVSFALPFLPTEYVFAEGSTLRLVIRGVGVADRGLTLQGPPGVFALEGGEGTLLRLPSMPLEEYVDMPRTARP